MLKRKNYKVAIVDRFPFRNWYSFILARELSKLFSQVRAKKIIHLYGPKKILHTDSPFYIFRSLWSPLLWPIQVINQSIKDKIEIIHIQFEFITFGHVYTSLLLIPFLLISKLIGIKIIITLHGPLFPKKDTSDIIDDLLPVYLSYFKSFFRVYCTTMYLIISKFTSAIIVHGHTFKNILHQYGINNSYSIPHGIGQIKDTNNEHSIFLKIDQEFKIILFFGVLSPRKGLEYLIKAFSKLIEEERNVVLLISGRESLHSRGYFKKINNLVHDLNIENRVLFSGYLEEDCINEIYQRAEIVVVPYLSSSSASGPLSLAMAYGKPIIATSTNYFSELLENNIHALLVPPKDVERLSKSMNVLLTNEYLRNKLSTNVKRKAKTHSWRIIANMTKELYNQVLNNDS